MFSKKQLASHEKELQFLNEQLFELYVKQQEDKQKFIEMTKELDQLNEKLNNLSRACDRSNPNFGKIRSLLYAYDSKDKALQRSDCPAFDDFLIKGMIDIEKEIELLVYPPKEEPCSTK